MGTFVPSIGGGADSPTDEEAVAEDEAAYSSVTHTMMQVPADLVPTVRELIDRRRSG
jgi:hypothetical protein